MCQFVPLLVGNVTLNLLLRAIDKLPDRLKFTTPEKSAKYPKERGITDELGKYFVCATRRRAVSFRQTVFHHPRTWRSSS